MNNEAEQLIRAALQKGYITSRQAEMLRDEIEMFPGQNVGTLMTRRNMLTPQQLAILRNPQSDSPGLSASPSGAGPAPSPVASHVNPRPVSGVAGMPPQLAPVQLPQKSPGSAGGQSQTPSGGAPVISTGLISHYVAPKPQPRDAKLADYLKMARDCGGSDLHIVTDRAPFIRQGGKLIYLEEPPLTPERSRMLNLEAMPEDARKKFELDQQVDFSFTIAGLGRHRCNVFQSRLGVEGAYRIIDNKVRTIDELGLPDVCKKLTEYHQGMVLVTGPCSSGKTTTCAALLDHINGVRHDHIISVEDPVEYILTPKSCQVTQREVGHHTQSFANALRGALRQDPDVILVGEMRDFETTSIAISAAETGHLVLGTLHTNTSIRAVARIMDLYPPSQRAQICVMVSESLRGVIAQQLIPRKDNNGLALALEILVFHSGVSAVIREGKTSQLPSLMQSGKKFGMKLMDESVMDLFKGGIISGRNAFLRADNKALFESVKVQD